MTTCLLSQYAQSLPSNTEKEEAGLAFSGMKLKEWQVQGYLPPMGGLSCKLNRESCADISSSLPQKALWSLAFTAGQLHDSGLVTLDLHRPQFSHFPEVFLLFCGLLELAQSQAGSGAVSS